MSFSVTFQCGNSDVTMKVNGFVIWEKGDLKREYFQLSSSAKETKQIQSIYKVISGSTRDFTVEVNGAIYGYSLGVDINSKVKRENAKNAVIAIIKHQEQK